MSVAEFERRSAARGAELRLSVPPDPREGLIVRREVLAFAEGHNIRGDEVRYSGGWGSSAAVIDTTSATANTTASPG